MNDSVLRCNYHIAIPEPRRGGEHIDAVFWLKITSESPRTMHGNYYMLPPFDENMLNCKWGSVTYRKINETYVVTPPTPVPDDEVENKAPFA